MLSSSLEVSDMRRKSELPGPEMFPRPANPAIKMSREIRVERPWEPMLSTSSATSTKGQGSKMSRSTLPETPRARSHSQAHGHGHGRTDSLHSLSSTAGIGSSMAPPHTPQHQLASRAGANMNIIQSSPHYTTTRRHSLYGTEDRIILDLGSRIWKIGFSGEGRPRDVFCVADEDEYGGWDYDGERDRFGVSMRMDNRNERTKSSLWSLESPYDEEQCEEERRQLYAVMQRKLRVVFHELLLTDPKSRKVIIVESPLMPMYIKDMIASILFENLQVPSISFASSHLLSLLAVGRITGLVLDVGHLESVALPIFTSRPLHHLLRATPLAGSRLTSHLRALLLMFGEYIPPAGLIPSSSSSAGLSSSISAGSMAIGGHSGRMRVPEEVLTDKVVEEVKVRCCFTGGVLEDEEGEGYDIEEMRVVRDDAEMRTEREVREGGEEMDVDADEPTRPTRTSPSSGSVPEDPLQSLARMYKRYSTATDLRLQVVHPPGLVLSTGSNPSGSGDAGQAMSQSQPPSSSSQPIATTSLPQPLLGTLIIPGWIRSRAADLLFETGDADEPSVVELLLDTLLKLPIDLRRVMAGSVLVTGGTAGMAGFVHRLGDEARRVLSDAGRSNARGGNGRRDPKKPPIPKYDPYASLRPLAGHIAILNDPSPQSNSNSRSAPSAMNISNAGKAPAFLPGVLAWVGGSLAGALKIGGEEVGRERWDEGIANLKSDSSSGEGEGAIPIQSESLDATEEDDVESESQRARPAMSTRRSSAAYTAAYTVSILPDWTRAPLGVGAPYVPRARVGA